MKGRLIYVMGPSGSGKSTLLRGLQRLLADRGCLIARRVITRPIEPSEPNTVPVTLTEFLEMEARGALAMSWRANGLAYGIPREINDTLLAGHDVLVNGSRAYLPEARKRYTDLVPILLQVDNDTLYSRLKSRGRETATQIQVRMARNELFDPLARPDAGRGQAIFVVDSSADAETAIRLAADYLQGNGLCA